jgi:hypothetical protein
MQASAVKGPLESDRYNNLWRSLDAQLTPAAAPPPAASAADAGT